MRVTLISPARMLQFTVLALAASCSLYASQEQSEPAAITRGQADAILAELRQIRQLLELQARPAGAPVPQKRSMKIEGGYSLGFQDAPLTMVEFTDYQCPFCRQFEASTFNEIRRQYIDTGKLRFVSRNYPLTEMHPDAMRAANAALCAGEQDQYWAMRDVLFGHGNALTEADILGYAAGIKLDGVAFRACLQGERTKPAVLKDVEDARSLRIEATPSFLIGRTTAYGVEGYIVAGAQPFADFEKILKESEGR